VILIAQDKANHIAWCELIAAVSGTIAAVFTVLGMAPLWAPPAAALGSAVLASGVKEKWDAMGHGTPDIDDFWNGVIGGALVALPLSIHPMIVALQSLQVKP
jgi:hypothetical protein